jgi:hypothetical protein
MLLLVVKIKDFVRTYLALIYSQSRSLHERYQEFKKLACLMVEKSDNLYKKLNIAVLNKNEMLLIFQQSGLSFMIMPPSFLLRHVLADTSFFFLIIVFILLRYLALHGPFILNNFPSCSAVEKALKLRSW